MGDMFNTQNSDECVYKEKTQAKMLAFFLVIRLGLEPRTQTLKVLCSTC